MVLGSMSLFDHLRAKWKHPDPAIRAQAAASLDDQEVLESLAENDADENVRLAALRALTDDGVVARFAQSAASEKMREAAVEKLKDVALLLRIATSDLSAAVRSRARARCGQATSGAAHLRATLAKLDIGEREAGSSAEFGGTLDEVCQMINRDPRFLINGDVTSEDNDAATAEVRDTTQVGWTTAPRRSSRVVARFVAQTRQPFESVPGAAGATSFCYVKVWRTGADKFELSVEEKQLAATKNAAAWSHASSGGPRADPGSEGTRQPG